AVYVRTVDRHQGNVSPKGRAGSLPNPAHQLLVDLFTHLGTPAQSGYTHSVSSVCRDSSKRASPSMACSPSSTKWRMGLVRGCLGVKMVQQSSKGSMEMS